MKNKKKHWYLVAYGFKGGSGSAILDYDGAVEGVAAIDALSQWANFLQENPLIENVAVNSFQFLGYFDNRLMKTGE